MFVFVLDLPALLYLSLALGVSNADIAASMPTCLSLFVAVKEIVRILSIRATTEGLTLSAEALSKLGEMGARTYLRFANQLLSPVRKLAHDLSQMCSR